MKRRTDPDIFKAYDIRGIYGEQIDGEVAERIARAFAHVLAGLAGKQVSELRVGMGRDMRLSAPELAARYREGLLAEGVHVLDAGQVGTEMLYYLVGSRALDGGLMCTASHNPKAYTGAKLVREGALALSGDAGIQEVRSVVEQQSDQAHGDGLAGAAGSAGAAARGALEEIDLYEEFQVAALRFIDPGVVTSAARRLKVVVDGGNGMAGPMVGPLLERLGLDLVELYWTPDGSFPDHEPNPLLPENRRLIIDEVKRAGADLGIAWDGDGDRCFFIDDGGAFVDGDFLTALLAESLLEKSPGEAVLYDVRASRAVPARGQRLLQFVHRLRRVGARVQQRQRRVLDQVGVHAPHLKGRWDRQAVDARLARRGQRLLGALRRLPRGAHERISASTSSRRRAMSSAETSDSRHRRRSGSVFEGRTLKCQSSYSIEIPSRRLWRASV